MTVIFNFYFNGDVETIPELVPAAPPKDPPQDGAKISAGYKR